LIGDENVVVEISSQGEGYERYWQDFKPAGRASRAFLLDPFEGLGEPGKRVAVDRHLTF
jgi:hypothetical protein